MIVVAGEVLLYFLTAQLVRRPRPDVPGMFGDLPAAASWPSGHAAAAVAVYGAVAALVVVLTTSQWRWLVLAFPVLLSPVIGITRVYVGAHHVSDVVAGLVLGSAWLTVCVRHLLLTDEAPLR